MNYYQTMKFIVRILAGKIAGGLFGVAQKASTPAYAYAQLRTGHFGNFGKRVNCLIKTKT